MEKIKFNLKQEHIALMRHLNFRTSVATEYDDKFIPEIDRKRPFGNSGVVYSAAEHLNRERDSEGDFSTETMETTERLLLELPVALEVVMKYQTFIPGEYEVDLYGAYSQYSRLCKYYALKKPLEQIENWARQQGAECRSQMISLHELCMNIRGDDPWGIIKDLKMFQSTPFLQYAIAVFEQAEAKEKTGEKQILLMNIC